VGKREDKKAETRRRLIAAALKEFSKRGYSQVNLDEVATQAGLTKGAVYSNFSSKAELALAVLDRRIDQPLAIFGQIDPDAEQDDQLSTTGRLLARELDDASSWFCLELECTVAATRNLDLLDKLRRRDQLMRNALKNRLKEHFTATEQAGEASEAMVTALIAVVNGIAFERLKDPASIPPSQIARILGGVQSSFGANTADRRSAVGG
jgi:AcrR family transcriptional regulator